MTRHKMQIVLLIFSLTLAAQALAEQAHRQDKGLNVINYVKFPNDVCTTTDGKSGTCYTASECSSLGGISSGTCASGFGVCCYISLTCGVSTSLNNTYFVSTGKESSPCILNVCRASDNICQIRMDFDNLDIDQPVSTSGTDTNPSAKSQCHKAMFYAATEGGVSPVICGGNAGYHMIVEARSDCNPITVQWTSDSTTRAWDIKISQIPCNVPWKPPQGCLQYFTGVTGVVYSYNYQRGIQLANQNYENCIRQEQGYCKIKYYSGNFEISGTSANAAVGESCTADFVSMARGGDVTTLGAGSNADRFCGGALSYGPTAATTIQTNQVPFQIGVYFDATETSTDKSLGFEIYYTQETSC